MGQSVPEVLTHGGLGHTPEDEEQRGAGDIRGWGRSAKARDSGMGLGLGTASTLEPEFARRR